MCPASQACHDGAMRHVPVHKAILQECGVPADSVMHCCSAQAIKRGACTTHAGPLPGRHCSRAGPDAAGVLSAQAVDASGAVEGSVAVPTDAEVEMAHRLGRAGEQEQGAAELQQYQEALAQFKNHTAAHRDGSRKGPNRLNSNEGGVVTVKSAAGHEASICNVHTAGDGTPTRSRPSGGSCQIISPLTAKEAGTVAKIDSNARAGWGHGSRRGAKAGTRANKQFNGRKKK